MQFGGHATKIQSRFRGRKMRRDKDQQQMNASATKIQAIQRGNILRRQKVDAEVNTSAAKIQARYRGKKERERAASSKRQAAASHYAVKIQKNTRGFLARSSNKKKEKAMQVPSHICNCNNTNCNNSWPAASDPPNRLLNRRSHLLPRVGNAVRAHEVRGNAVRAHAVRGHAVRGNAVRAHAVRGNAVRGNAVRAKHPRTLQPPPARLAAGLRVPHCAQATGALKIQTRFRGKRTRERTQQMVKEGQAAASIQITFRKKRTVLKAKSEKRWENMRPHAPAAVRGAAFLKQERCGCRASANESIAQAGAAAKIQARYRGKLQRGGQSPARAADRAVVEEEEEPEDADPERWDELCR